MLRRHDFNLSTRAFSRSACTPMRKEPGCSGLPGVHRAELFERTAARRPLRLHDLRATFITINMALGRSEAWICDRTGHRSSQMLNTYRRAARTAAELGLGDLAPLDECVPELSPSERWGEPKVNLRRPVRVRTKYLL